MKKEFHFLSISSARNALMGIATLWVMLYHSGIPFSGVDGAGISHYFYIIHYYLYVIKSIGQIGVDIFLFLSAIGLYFSMEKNDNVISFYKRRLQRIIPEYLIVNLIWELINFSSPVETLCNISGLSFFMDGFRGNWYFILLFILYFLFPLLYRLKKEKGDQAILILILVILGCNYLISTVSPALFSNIEIALRRIPVFLLGLWIADEVKKDIRINGFFILSVSLIVALASFLYISNDENNMNILYRYNSSLNGVAIVFLFSFIHSFFKRKNYVFIVLEYCGTYSMECYLLYEKVLKILSSYVSDKISLALLGFFICFTIAMFLKKAQKMLVS